MKGGDKAPSRTRQRLDKLMAERGLAETRNRAAALIMAGKVRVGGQVVTKAGTAVPPDAEITVDNERQWASRGAYKLLGAFERFQLDVKGMVCADIGASTGGFTDVLLSKGAARVYAVDVGYGQLLWRLASDPRVTVMDRTNARNLTADDFDEPVQFASCDASFISLKLLLPVIDGFLAPDGAAVVLIKPQFEAGRERMSGTKGVIRDPAVHAEVLREVTDFITRETRLYVSGLAPSPIRGPEGNVEFLCYLTRPAATGRLSHPDDVGFAFDPDEIARRAGE